METPSYENLEYQGKYDQILKIAKSQEGYEAKFWKLKALFALGRFDELYQLYNSYFPTISDKIWITKFESIKIEADFIADAPGVEDFREYYNYLTSVVKNAKTLDLYHEHALTSFRVVDFMVRGHLYSTEFSNDQELSKLYQTELIVDILQHAIISAKSADAKDLLSYSYLEYSLFYKFELHDDIKSNELMELATQTLDEHSRSYLTILIKINVATEQYLSGDLDNLDDLYSKLFVISQKINAKVHQANVLVMWGIVLKREGNFSLSFEKLQNALHLTKKLNLPGLSLVNLLNLIDTRTFQGELSAALELYDEVDNLLVRLTTFSLQISNIQWLLAVISIRMFSAQGEYEKAVSITNKYNLSVWSNSFLYAEILLEQIKAYLFLGDKDQALEILKSLAKYAKPNTMFDIYHKYGKAIYLKSSNRNRDKSQAEFLFLEIVDKETSHTHLVTNSIVHLLELFVYEFQLYKQNEVLEDIQFYLDKLIEIASTNHMPTILIEGLIIQARFKAVMGEYESGISLLRKSLSDAKQQQLITLAKKIELQIELIETEFGDLKHIIESNSQLANRIDKSNLVDYIKQAHRATKSNE